MFERDKTELRELGVPLETGRNSGFDTTDGYRIARHDYELGEIDLEPDEAAAVALAARLWDTPAWRGGARRGAQAARGRGGGRRDGSGRCRPRVRAVEPAFGPTAGGRAGRSGGDLPAPPRRPDRRGRRRTVEPWGWCRRAAAGTWWATTATGGRPLVPALPDRGAGDDARAAGAVQVPPGVDLLAVVDRGVACRR
jgi:proteasome accessory factor B